MVIGYIRSPNNKERKDQKILLAEAGCEKVFKENCSGKIERSAFDKMAELVRTGDKVIVSSLYVFPLTMIELVGFLKDLETQKVGFMSLREKISKTSVFPYLYNYQKRSKSERAIANLNDGRKGNKNSGRPKGISDEAKKEVYAVAKLYKLHFTIDQIMKELGMTSRSQVYKRLGEAKIKPQRRIKIIKSE